MLRRPIERRLRRLEARHGSRIAIMWRHVDEPDQAAYQRWQAANPTVRLTEADLSVIVVRWSSHGDSVMP